MDEELVGRRILVVEDEGLIALDIKDLLEGWGCSVIGPVANVAQALELIATNHPDAAVLDVHLGGETSEPIAVVLRAAGSPFLLLTAYQRGHLTGALKDAVLLTKPVDEGLLRQELSALLIGHPDHQDP